MHENLQFVPIIFTWKMDSQANNSNVDKKKSYLFSSK